jgi:hypothetical protein
MGGGAEPLSTKTQKAKKYIHNKKRGGKKGGSLALVSRDHGGEEYQDRMNGNLMLIFKIHQGAVWRSPTTTNHKKKKGG